MNTTSWMEIVAFVAALVLLTKPLGHFMALVYQGRPCGLDKVLGPIERLLYRLCGIDPKEEMGWKPYAFAALTFSFVSTLAVYFLQRFQAFLPLNPQGLAAPTPDLAFNTATSFATNTNWQAYSGESTLSYLTQMLGLNVQNFVSAAAGMAVLVALIRGLTRRNAETIGNFWVDLTRSTLYILVPLSFVLAVALVSQGVVQSFSPVREVALVESVQDAEGKEVTTQSLPLGPAASQIAIKQLGTNGGGFFGVNSAHPFENSTPLSNFLQVLAILILPAALCYTFGEMVGDTRQGWALFSAMLLIFVPFLLVCVFSEAAGNPRIAALGVDQTSSALQCGGNMEGKEARFGIGPSALWATVTTAASNGSVNAMHDSFTPLGGLVPMLLMQLGEVVYGGAGSGLYGMLMFALVAVFVAGLMVGRTPEYLGKKIEAYEMKMASLVILFPCLVVLVGTAVAVVLPAGTATIANPGPHGFSEVLYAFSSAGNNNGSAFGGLGVNNPFYNVMLAFAMLISRFWLMVPALAIAGSLARKKLTPAGSGTLPTHTPLFVVMLAGIVLLVGALTFVPALALGPVVEHLQMVQGAGV
ncbi:potassium-transporting ATPase subunit KdpA [Planctomyces sp. SH-PL14]|uniref:potassium-transporting ATPase subunit KdpA n=1 Tax=Planctomyces sp. SH-PL14 TaxID=1632864 RepID=UPI00078D6B8C|nr:potassium-transporting ATPase subunit KdpA [Planctomyces sp. SH-PL14]AMV19447.1 Potassium-transporting ATPase A chain [Planctomyces sp. SH-PL14]